MLYAGPVVRRHGGGASYTTSGISLNEPRALIVIPTIQNALGGKRNVGPAHGAQRGKDRLPTPFSQSIFSQDTHSNAIRAKYYGRIIVSLQWLLLPLSSTSRCRDCRWSNVLFRVPKDSPCENSRSFLLSFPHPLLSPFHEPSGPH